MPLIKQNILNAGASFFRKIQKMDFESKELILLILTIYDPCVSLINRATDTKMSQTKSHNVPLWLLHKRLAKDCQVRKICGPPLSRQFLSILLEVVSSCRL